MLQCGCPATAGQQEPDEEFSGEFAATEHLHQLLGGSEVVGVSEPDDNAARAGYGERRLIDAVREATGHERDTFCGGENQLGRGTATSG